MTTQSMERGSFAVNGGERWEERDAYLNGLVWKALERSLMSGKTASEPVYHDDLTGKDQFPQTD